MTTSIWLEPLISGAVFGIVFALFGALAARRAARKAATAGPGEAPGVPQYSMAGQIGSALFGGVLFGLIQLTKKMREANLIGPSWDYVLNGIMIFGLMVIAIGIAVFVAKRLRAG